MEDLLFGPRLPNTVTIDVAKWAYGHARREDPGHFENMLFESERNGGVACALGFALLQAGVPEEDLNHEGDVQNFVSQYLGTEWPWNKWYFSTAGVMHLFDEVYEINDSPSMAMRDRKRQLIDAFARAGIRLTFVDSSKAQTQTDAP